MREIMAEDQPFVRHEHTIDRGLSLFADQPFKREIIEAVGAGHDEVDAAVAREVDRPRLHLLELTTFIDLCLGPARPLHQPPGPLR
jgi:threonyl-tRNA synthetase